MSLQVGERVVEELLRDDRKPFMDILKVHHGNFVDIMVAHFHEPVDLVTERLIDVGVGQPLVLGLPHSYRWCWNIEGRLGQSAGTVHA